VSNGISEAPPSGIGKLLMDARFVLPRHQRDYSWTEDEVRQLLDDVDDAIERKDKTYFLGLMVFMASDNGELIVLDGQQRLATTVILFSAVRSWLSQYSQHTKDANQIQEWFIGRSELGETTLHPRLMLNSINNPTFASHIVKSVPVEAISSSLAKLKRSDQNRALLEAALYCRERISKLAKRDNDAATTAKRLIQTVNYLRDNVGVVRLTVTSQAAAFTIFETLNDRGRPLSPLDLVKLYLFERAEKAETHSKSRIPDMESRWIQMMATLSSVKSSGDFLKTFWTSRHGRVQTPYLYEKLKEQYKTPDDAINLSIDMLTVSEQYAALEVADDPVWMPYSKATRESVRSLKLLGGQQVHSIILAALNKFAPHEVERLMRLLEYMIVRYQLIGGGRTGKLEIACAAIAKNIHDEEIKDASGAFKEFKTINPTDEEFQAAFGVKTERSNQKAHYLLRAIEMQERRSGANAAEEQIGDVTVEHILPRSPGAEWNPVINADDALVDDCVYRLGNLCLLGKINKDIGNASFQRKKKEAFARSGILTTKELGNYSAWDRKSIEQRQARMAKLAVSVWRFQ
jgi:hypothetical protein